MERIKIQEQFQTHQIKQTQTAIIRELSPGIQDQKQEEKERTQLVQVPALFLRLKIKYYFHLMERWGSKVSQMEGTGSRKFRCLTD